MTWGCFLRTWDLTSDKDPRGWGKLTAKMTFSAEMPELPWDGRERNKRLREVDMVEWIY